MKLLALALLLPSAYGQIASPTPVPVPAGSRVALSMGGVTVEAVLGAGMVLVQSTNPPTLLKATVDAADYSPWIVIGSIRDWGGPTIPARKCVERSMPAPGVYPSERLATGYPATLDVSLSPSMYTIPGLIVVKLCNVGEMAVQAPNGQTFSAEIMRR